MSFETVSVIGLGYIGLPTAAMFASKRKKVIGVDVNKKAVDIINRGEIHIVEPELDILVHASVTEGYFRASTTAEPADAFLIAVPTPFKAGSSVIPEPDLGYIEAAAKSIAPVLEKGNLVVLESTSPVGATEQLAAWLAQMRPELTFPQSVGSEADIKIAYCPERVLPGHVVRELVENDRVIGGMSPECSAAAIKLYKTFVEGECIITDSRTAEMAKLTENSSRDVQIAFANELSLICDEINVDVWELIKLANRHPRVNILQPGPGVGGHCIAVDPWFIISKSPDSAKLIHTARKVNDSKPLWVVDKVNQAVGEFLQSRPERTAKSVTIGCYGLAFKPDIDDLRESPAMQIVQEVRDVHAGKILVVEPNIESVPTQLGEVELVDLEDALSTCDIHLLLVDHKEFKSTEIDKSKLVIDTKGIWL
ncbi:MULTISPECIES: UDP-N-acetyl-D-mannosamine dehydrogenase [unclassified Pseudoalteromonas]|uniref:UDP-N-acetyl-D-mannosamine dehydrogenase n=1 Tax=unclassified Pseudoalteromonas TaxID=194690 RepID=UPI00209787C1|nr:UDP-N-acetyl-D-mannosamine dehydrogenase [Pseudoalteromonas sp. XMcav2-N]MCO7188724.1 UDP-N-acetyl-D-mannosamine dehydrogenase [Pseudoalteromonas sp. XMcav2-N]